VRAFWMAIPPATPELPPGDKAFLATDPKGVAVLGLFDDGGQVDTVFQATDGIERGATRHFLFTVINACNFSSWIRTLV
jgi:hypothetical protein